jgi:predicted lipoprotein
MQINSFIFSLGLVGITGCAASNSAQVIAPQISTHQSQAVYLVEFDAAQQFSVKAHELEASFNQYCAGNNSLENVQQSWRETASKWMALQGQDRGPIDALAQNWNIQFWPDKKNTTGLKMKGLVATSEPLSSAFMSEQSVAVQGLGSLEWLLFDESSPVFHDTSTEVCRVGNAMTENFASNSQIILTAWQQNPWLELDAQAWQSEYLSLIANQLAFSTSKLERPLASIGSPRPYFSEAWRSKYSLHLLRLNIETLSSLYHVDGNGLDTLLRAQGSESLADRIDNQFAVLLDNWPLHDDLFDSLQTRTGYQQALGLLNKLKQLDYLLNQEAAAALGVVIGFNSTDGD